MAYATNLYNYSGYLASSEMAMTAGPTIFLQKHLVLCCACT